MTTDDLYPSISLQKHADWLDQRPLTHEDGRVVARFGFVMTLYFDRANDVEQRSMLMALVKRFRAWVGEEQLQWWASSATGKMHLQRKKKFDADAIWKKVAEKKEAFSLAMSSIDNGEDDGKDDIRSIARVPTRAQRFLLNLYAGHSAHGFGYIRIHFPMLWGISHPEETSLVAWFRSCCEAIKPIYGTFGLGLLLPIETITQSDPEYGYPITQVVKRFPGLEVESPKFEAENGMSTINWLTVIHDKWLERLGGRSTIKQALQPPVSAHDWSEGLMLKAGEEPVTGDSEINLDIPQYRVVARLLKPLRTQKSYYNIWLYEPGPDRDTKVDTNAVWYLTRFD